MKKNDNESQGRACRDGVEALWRGMLDIIPAAAYMCDAKGLITYFNPFAETLWGRAPKLRHASERYCGSHQMYLPDGTPIRHEECWMALALLEDKAYIGRKIVIERRDGSRVVGETYVYPLRNDLRQTVGAVNLVADITTQDQGTVAPRLHHPAVSKDAALAMIAVAASVLTAMTWETSAFR